MDFPGMVLTLRIRMTPSMRLLKVTYVTDLGDLERVREAYGGRIEECRYVVEPAQVLFLIQNVPTFQGECHLVYI